MTQAIKEENKTTHPGTKGEGPPESKPPVGPLDVSYVGLSLKNIVTTVTNQDPANLYYEQYCIDEDYFRLGKGLSLLLVGSHVIVM